MEIPGERVVSKVKKQGKHELKPEFPEGFAVGEGIQTNINLLWEVYQYFFEKKRHFASLLFPCFVLAFFASLRTPHSVQEMTQVPHCSNIFLIFCEQSASLQQSFFF